MDYFSHYHSDCMQIWTFLGRLVPEIGVWKASIPFNKAGKAKGYQLPVRPTERKAWLSYGIWDVCFKGLKVFFFFSNKKHIIFIDLDWNVSVYSSFSLRFLLKDLSNLKSPPAQIPHPKLHLAQPNLLSLKHQGLPKLSVGLSGSPKTTTFLAA